MIINYLCWSSLISMFATLMLYPLRNQMHGARVTRMLAAMFTFVSLTGAIISAIMIFQKEVIFISTSRLPLVKLQFGFQLTESNILIIIAINLLMAILIFMASNRNLVNLAPALALSSLFIFIIAATPDQLVRVCALSLGTIALTAVIIAEEADQNIIAVLSRDFIINRVSDFFAFTALLHVLLRFNFFITNEIDAQANDIEFIHNLFFFVAIALRLMSTFHIKEVASKLIVFYRLLLGLGSQLLLLFYASSNHQSDKQLTIFLVVTAALLLYAIFIALIGREEFLSLNNVVNLSLVLNLFLILLGFKELATAVICLLIVTYPTANLASLKRPIKTASADNFLQTFLVSYDKYVGTIAAKIVNIAGSIVVNFINVIYANVLLFRLPQFILAALQIPLRFVNNGSIQRSLFFVVITLLAYSYWWKDT